MRDANVGALAHTLHPAARAAMASLDDGKVMDMNYRFQSKAAGDVLMLEADGDAVLTAMGIATATKGIIEPGVMAAALRAIEGAIERAEASPIAAGADADDEGARYVSLRQRAWPLMEMLKRSLAASVPIVWGV